MKIYLFSLNPEASVRNQWDFGLIKSLFDDLGYDYSQDYDHFDYGMERGIVVLPARHHIGLEQKINTELAKLPSVKLILIGDEEGQFNVDLISHPNIEIMVQNPNPEQHDKYKRLGTGFPKHFIDSIPKALPEKSLDFYFAGQSTYHAPELKPPMNVNYRRKEMADELENIKGGKIVRSKGFTQGEEPSHYYRDMANAKVAPCPSGPELPDTFRLFEALELGCVPIADEKVHKFSKEPKEYKGYWEWFFGEVPPFPIAINGWSDAVEFAKENYPDLNNKCQSWWYQKKWELKEWLMDFNQHITVVIPVSPIKSHPSTEILDETIASIRHHMPKVKIIVSFDGVREEQQELGMAYIQHIRAVLWKHRDIYPVIFGEHRHQSGMMKELLANHITTPTIMYVEQDTPLEKDYIDFGAIFDLIESGESNLVRFHHESSIPKEHEHMMLGKVDVSELEEENKLMFVKTVQWSQRPHIASTAFYRQIMGLFSPDSKSFIEDFVHGLVWNAYLKDGKAAYNLYRLHIYHPDGNIRRSYHTDGRKGAEKYDNSQIF
jgi:hypothetical protein